jgi:hypothetical protein
MNLLSIFDDWQRFLALPIVGGLLAILRRIHPLALLRRVFSFGIGVSEREMLLAHIDSERASGLRWKSKYDQCVLDLIAADAENAQLRTQRAVPGD